MGRAIDREEFADSDYVAFERRLHENLDALSDLLARPGFGEGPLTIGSELEVHLVDSAGRPCPVNHEVLEAARDERLTLELARYNLELNTRPLMLAGSPFRALAAELRELLALAERAARAHGAQTAMIGMLPTVALPELGSGALSDSNRFRALARGVRRLRGEPGEIDLALDSGPGVRVAPCDVTSAGPATSFQVHLRVSPRDFARVFNATQLATAPALAVAASSPLFLSHELWDETRIALLPQAFECRPRSDSVSQSRVPFGGGWCEGGILELFVEAVREHPPLLPVVDASSRESSREGAPALHELRLHQGTIWRWNRPVYDPSAGGHVRVEMRALPAGPTLVDMMANAAFMLGLALGLASDIEASTRLVSFADAERNFLEAARRGLDAELVWPGPRGREWVSAARLVRALVPVARHALVDAGVSPAAVEPLLEVIDERARTRQTGARWQREVHRARCARGDPELASRELLTTYVALSRKGSPVHEWETRVLAREEAARHA